METRRITVLSAGLGVPSSSRLLADQLAASAERQLAAAGYAVDRRGRGTPGPCGRYRQQLRDRLCGAAAGRGDRRRRGLRRHHRRQPGLQRLLQRTFQILHRRPGPQVAGGQGRPARCHRRHGPPPDGAGLRDAAAVHVPAHPRSRPLPCSPGPQDWGNNDDGGSPLSARIDRAAGEFAACCRAPLGRSSRRRWSRCRSNSCSPASRPAASTENSRRASRTIPAARSLSGHEVSCGFY